MDENIRRKHQEIEVKQYHSLRRNFYRVISHILGDDYYNYASDVYQADERACDDIIYEYDNAINRIKMWKYIAFILIGIDLLFFLFYN